MIIERVGLPLASMLILTLAATRAVHALANGRPPAVRKREAWIVYAGVAWAIVTVIAGAGYENIVVWVTLFFGIVLAPSLLVGTLNRTGYVLLRTGQIALTAEVVAVLVQQVASPNLFGLILEPQNPLRSSGIHYNPNGGAFYILLALLLVGSLLRHETSLALRYWSVVLLPSGAFAVLLTGSRGALLALAIATVLGLGLQVGQQEGRRNWSYVILMLLVASLPGFFYFGAVPGFVTTALEERGRVTSENDRLNLWGRAVDRIGESPIFGGARFQSPGFQVDNAHNAFLETAIRFGLVGSALFLILLGTFIVAFWTHRNSAAGGAGLVMMTAAITFSLTHTGILDNTLLWVLLTLLLATTGHSYTVAIFRGTNDQGAAPSLPSTSTIRS